MISTFNILPNSVYNSMYSKIMLNEWDIILPLSLQRNILNALFSDDPVSRYVVKIGNFIFNPTYSHDDISYKECIFVHDDICVLLHATESPTINIIYNILDVKLILLRKTDRN